MPVHLDILARKVLPVRETIGPAACGLGWGVTELTTSLSDLRTRGSVLAHQSALSERTSAGR